MSVDLASDVEAFVAEQVQAGACPSAAALVNDMLRALRIQTREPLMITPELEAWLLEAAESPTTPLVHADFEAIRDRAQARAGIAAS